MPGELTVRSILRSSHLLRALPDDELDSLAVDCRMYRVEKSETIWTHGSTVDFFGLVGFGFVKMTKTSPTGTDVSLEIMGPGQIFGLLGVLTGDGCSLSAVALTDSVYVRIPKGAFERVYEGSGPLKDKLLRKTALRMHQKLDFMAMLSTGKVEERIAAVLFILAESYGELDGRQIRRIDCRNDIGKRLRDDLVHAPQPSRRHRLHRSLARSRSVVQCMTIEIDQSLSGPSADAAIAPR